MARMIPASKAGRMKIMFLAIALVTGFCAWWASVMRINPVLEKAELSPPCVTKIELSPIEPPPPPPSSSSTKPKIVPDKCDSPSRGHFDKIYTQGGWGKRLRPNSDFYTNAEWPPSSTRQVSASGVGSNLGYNTQHSLEIIKDAIKKFSAKSMIDIPCGDVNWILDSLETDTLPLYVGLDIASAVINASRQRFAHHVNKQFFFWDATSCVLPRFRNGTTSGGGGEALQPFDLVHVRDVIQHMHLRQGVQFICNVFLSGAKVLIATMYPKEKANYEIQEGSFYHNNFLLEPFSFPQVEECTPTHPKLEADVTCVYDLSKPWVQEFISAKCKVSNVVV